MFQKSPELMDILTFVKEINFEIKDNLGFDVLWDSMTGKRRCPRGGIRTTILPRGRIDIRMVWI
jgi:hypothetical protein